LFSLPLAFPLPLHYIIRVRCEQETMRLSLHYRGKLIDLNFDKEEVTVRDILKKLNLSRDYAFVIVNGEIADENQVVSAQDEIRVVNAISGG